jgi:uncharacterized protein involved in outer membrane biogenesis
MKLKWILTGLAVVVVAVVAAGYAVLSAMNFEDLRGVIEAEAKKATGRELSVAGPIDLEISLSPAIAVEDVRFANAAWGSRADMVSVKRLEVEVALLPLLSGDIQVKRLVLIEPDILLETGKKGQGNWVMAGAEAEDEDGTEDAGALPSFDQVVVRNGRVSLSEAIAGEPVVVGLSALSVRSAGRASPVELAVDGRYNGTPVSFEGTFGSFDQLVGGAAFPVKLAGSAAGADIEVEGTIAKPLTGQGFDLRLSVAGERLADLNALAPRELPPLGPYALNGQVREKDGRYHLTGFSARLADTRLEADGAIDAALSGRGLDMRLSVEGERLADLNALAGQELPPLGPYALSAEVREKGGRYTLTGLAARVAGSDLAGNGTIAPKGKRPAIAGSFSAGTLDLADFGIDLAGPARDEPAAPAPEAAEPEAPAVSATEREAAQTAPDRQADREFIFTEEPLPLDALKTVDAKVELSVGTLRVKPGMVFSDVEVSLGLENGRLSVGSFGAGFAGGRLAGDLSLDARQAAPPVALNMTAAGIDYGALLKDLEVTDGVTGRMDATVNVRGAGASARAIASGLSGRVEVVGGQGTVRSGLLQAGGVGFLDLLSGWREGDSDLRLNCVVARLPIVGGVAKSEAILFDTEAVTVGGSGKVDLGREAYDLKVTPQAKQTSLMSLAVPVLVTGPLEDPSVVPDPVGTAVGAAKIAGMFINPLAAGALIVLESETSDQNPCVAALAKAGTGAGGGEPQQADKSTVEKATEGVTDTIEGVGEGLTKGLKSLFGD